MTLDTYLSIMSHLRIELLPNIVIQILSIIDAYQKRHKNSIVYTVLLPPLVSSKESLDNRLGGVHAVPNISVSVYSFDDCHQYIVRSSLRQHTKGNLKLVSETRALLVMIAH